MMIIMTRTEVRGLKVGAAAAVSMLFGVVATPASASHHEGPACFPVRGRITTELTADDCSSPVGLCTNGYLRSTFGLLSGRTHFEAGGLGGDPVGESSIVTPPAEPGTTWAYSGVLTVHTRVGTITFSDVGVLDSAQGLFTEIDRPTSGTQALRGVTGALFVSGHTTPDGNGFDGDITGELCLPRR
jgi:hypothetical protein